MGFKINTDLLLVRRKEAGKSATYVASAMGVRLNQLSTWVHGSIGFPEERLKQYIEIVGMTEQPKDCYVWEDEHV